MTSRIHLSGNIPGGLPDRAAGGRAPLSRRRMLTLSAAALVTTGATTTPVRWSGRALGAEIALTLHAPEPLARSVIAEIRADLDRIERQFSLYRDSALTRLNATGTLMPAPIFVDLIHKADRANRMTGGIFDPTVQPLWEARAAGRPLPLDLVGWDRVAIGRRVVLGPGQALTFNGIAQGYATDRARAILRRNGLTDVLVDIGEVAGDGGPWHLGIVDPEHGLVATRTLRSGAIATSSRAPDGMEHVFGPDSTLSTVSVEAEDAWLADAISTAALVAPAELRNRMARLPGVRRILTVDRDGNIRTLQPG